MQSSRFGLFALLATLGMGWTWMACSAPPVKMKCEEIRARLDLQDLSEDQKRFAEEELKDCEKQLNEAHQHDSSAVENLENHFTPKDSL